MEALAVETSCGRFPELEQIECWNASAPHLVVTAPSEEYFPLRLKRVKGVNRSASPEIVNKILCG